MFNSDFSYVSIEVKWKIIEQGLNINFRQDNNITRWPPKKEDVIINGLNWTFNVKGPTCYLKKLRVFMRKSNQSQKRVVSKGELTSK